MPTTHGHNATTWRDLADQLTPEQVDKLLEFEGRRPESQADLLEWARECSERNLDDTLHFGHLDRPEGATQVYGCGERTDGRGWSREFTGTSRRVDGVSVRLNGTQFADGTVERTLAVGVDDLAAGPGGALTAAAARQLAAALIEAADELDRMARIV